MCQNNKQSFQIDFRDLSNKVPTLAIWLAEEPALIIPMFNIVAMDLVTEMYPDYENTHQNIFVRVDNLPVEDKLRELRQVHLNALVKFRGVVTKRTGVFPEYSAMYFSCVCGDIKGPFYGNNQFEAKMKIGQCVSCTKLGPYTISEQQTIYRNY
jgi:DNA replication licensing factor MCM2